MKNESMIEDAYNVLSAASDAMSFTDLWAKVQEDLEIGVDEKDNLISRFYTFLSLDGRFVQGMDNSWNLRDRVHFDDIHNDIDDLYADTDTGSADETDAQENKEYDESVQGQVTSDEDEGASSEDEDGEAKQGVDLQGTGFENRE